MPLILFLNLIYVGVLESSRTEGQNRRGQEGEGVADRVGGIGRHGRPQEVCHAQVFGREESCCRQRVVSGEGVSIGKLI
jgi:hypothetical protein